MKTIEIEIQGKKPHVFKFSIYESSTPDDHQIEDDFYKKFAGKDGVPVGTHFEAEIKEWASLKEAQFASKLHTHTSTKTSKEYICWIGHVSTIQALKKLLRMWSIGSVFTLEKGIQFDLATDAAGVSVNDFDAFEEFFKQNHDISFLSMNSIV